MNKTDLVSLDGKSILKRLDELKTSLFHMKMEKATTGIQKYSEYKRLKKEIARHLTELNTRTA